MAIRKTLRPHHGLLAAAVVFGLGAARVDAYIDPGTGSSMLSSLGIMLGAAGAVAAVCFTQARHWGRHLINRFTASDDGENGLDETGES